ncbi:hypothetical protein [Streptomyces sp. WMMC897]|uniref:hypothetical protein n=1 Tax=Streptomyces sp. WMMC897 TaxID=3014782 RepID=UPI0022B5E9BD|nr:hypothetical protein [Streptomyces sp. WMMC897]MCZ7414304.1 hypothetical protein [Streptomyces sp. WMMC897]
MAPPPAAAASRRERAAAALRPLWAWARGAFDGWDVLIGLSALALLVGLARTFTLGIALIVLGALGLVGGVLGARGEVLGELLAVRKGGGG